MRALSGRLEGLPRRGDDGDSRSSLPNLVNPFWMLPLLGILKLQARDIVGYGLLQLAVHVPVVIFLCWLFARTIPHVPPLK
jgi:short-chain fatty acids transporter